MSIDLKQLRKATGGGTQEDHEHRIREYEQRTGKKVQRLRISKKRSRNLKLR